MNKHVVAIGVLVLALGFMADKCAKLEKKLELRSLECECYKFTSKVWQLLAGADETEHTDEKKEA